MKRVLEKVESLVYHYVDGNRVDGPHSRVTGDLSGVRGNLFGVSGDLSGVRGDLDDCEISDEDRRRGINISDLIKE